jgi:hypothetical protein
MIRITIELQPAEATALREASQLFQLDDARHLLRCAKNYDPDALYAAVTKLREAIDKDGFP